MRKNENHEPAERLPGVLHEYHLLTKKMDGGLFDRLLAPLEDLRATHDDVIFIACENNRADGVNTFAVCRAGFGFVMTVIKDIGAVNYGVPAELGGLVKNLLYEMLVNGKRVPFKRLEEIGIRPINFTPAEADEEDEDEQEEDQ